MLFGGAWACNRAARFGVSPTTSICSDAPSPISLADQHLAGGDPDAHAKHDVAERAQARDIAHDAKGCTNGAFGVVLVRLRVAEIRKYPVATEPRDLAAVLFDRGNAARLIGTEKNAHLLGVQPRREFRRCRKVRKQDRQLPSLGALVRARCGLVGRGRRQFRGGPAQPFLDRMHETPAKADRKSELFEVVFGQVPQRIKVDVLVGQTRGELAESPTVQPCDHVRHFKTNKARFVAPECVSACMFVRLSPIPRQVICQ